VDWRIWRIVTANIATLGEIQNYWSINDLADANEALDIKEEADEFYAKRELRK